MNKAEFLNFYFSFKGRLNRRPYLLQFLLIWFVGYIITALLDHFIFGLRFVEANHGYISYAWALIALVPSYALGCRRMHDFDYSGWWQLLTLGGGIVGMVLVGISGLLVKVYSLPTAGTIILVLAIIMMVIIAIWSLILNVMMIFRKGTNGVNRFGNDPLETNLIKDIDA